MALQPWMMEVNAAGMAAVAEALDLHVDGQILCTACGGSVQSQFAAWACARCAARGNPLVYAALALGAGRGDAPSSASWRAVHRILADRGLCRAS